MNVLNVLIVATKATGLQAGLARIKADPQLVVPLLNGLDHMALLRDRFGPEQSDPWVFLAMK